jgi:phosphohistidine phosphatase
MKALYLLRHAKSSWSDPLLDDFDRPLNERGRRATGLIAQYMASHGIAPDLVLCSTAQRARETAQRIFAGDAPVVFEDVLYLASADQLLARLRAVTDDVGAVMLVGHNPGIENLAVALMGDGDAAAGGSMMTKFSTGALACFSVAADRWRDLAPDGARLDTFIRPRDLIK